MQKYLRVAARLLHKGPTAHLGASSYALCLTCKREFLRVGLPGLEPGISSSGNKALGPKRVDVSAFGVGEEHLLIAGDLGRDP
jgi:hypothetical protein